MLLKRADDKSKRIALLEDLQKSALLDARQKKWLREELGRTRKGIEGERDSAHFLDQYFKNGANHVVLHDLRFDVDGDVAQIDHLVLNRLGFMFLIETKNYAGNVDINSHGEFTVDYDGDRFGVQSPLEQSRRHERVLRRLLERLGVSNRFGELAYHHVVMFHPRAVITRPPAKDFDTSYVIKADQFPSWHQGWVDKTVGFGTLMVGLANVRTLETAKEWGEKLMRQHRPANMLELPAFMTPAAPVAVAAQSAPRDAVKPSMPSAASAPETSTNEVPLCPRCELLMVRRTAQRGQNVGASFWGCTSFPKCRGTRTEIGI